MPLQKLLETESTARHLDGAGIAKGEDTWWA